MALGLPFLEAMLPRLADSAPAFPNRLALVFMPGGCARDLWLTQGIAPLAPVKQHVNVLTGLNIQAGQVNTGTHEGGNKYVFTGNGPVSAEQLVGAARKEKPLVVNIQQNYGDQADEKPSYGCSDDKCSASFNGGNQVSSIWGIGNVYDSLFGKVTPPSGGGPTPMPDTSAQKKALARRRRLLNAVNEDAKRLRAQLGVSDQKRVDEYLAGVASIENKVMKLEEALGGTTGTGGMPAASCEASKPNVANSVRTEVAKAYADVLVKAFQCGLNTSAMLMLGQQGSNMTFQVNGSAFEHHNHAGHNGGDATKKQAKAAIDAWHVEIFAYFVAQLAQAKDGDGVALIDRSAVLMSSEIAESNLHDSENMPVLLAGKCGGALNPGRTLALKGYSIGDVLLTLLPSFGINQTSFGAWGTKQIGSLS